MLEEGIFQTTFLHKSILEYHAAAFIKHSNDDLAKMFYEAALIDFETWEEVLTFLRQIDPYRFARYFSIPSHQRMRELLGANETGASDEDLIKCVDHFLPEVGVGYGIWRDNKKDQETGRYTPVQYGPFTRYHEPVGYLSGALHDRVMNGLLKDAPEFMSKSAILERHELFKPDESHPNMYQLSAVDIVREYGGTELIHQLRSFELDVHSNLTEAQSLISQEDKKKLIFQPKQV
jgi:hypothetical protein